MSKIMKGIPRPENKPSIIAEDLRKLELEDCVDIPVGDNPAGRRSSIYMTATRLGIKVSIRRNENNFRTWRVE